MTVEGQRIMAFNEVIQAIRFGLGLGEGPCVAMDLRSVEIIRSETYPAEVTIAKRELHELTIKIDRKHVFQINVQEVPQ